MDVVEERFQQLDNPTGVTLDQYKLYLKDYCITVDFVSGFANYCKTTEEVHIYVSRQLRNKWDVSIFKEFLDTLPKPVLAPCDKRVARWAKQFGFKQHPAKSGYIILE